MRKATLRTLTEFLGLSAQQVADFAGVNKRTAQRWADTKMPVASDVPETVTQWLYELLEWFNDTVDMVLDEVDAEAERQSGHPKVVNLSRYITDQSARVAGLDVPASCHAALQGYILATLRAEGYDAEVSWVAAE